MVILPHRRKYMVSHIPVGGTVLISECVITLSSDRVPYSGSACTVDVVVTWNGAVLVVNTDYTLSWANNVNVGPATVTITGMGRFSGSVTKTFYISENVEPEWEFDIQDAELVDEMSVNSIHDNNSGFFYSLPVIENYDEDGNAAIPLHYWEDGYVLIKGKIYKDGNGELHLGNLLGTYTEPFDPVPSTSASFNHPFYIGKNRMYYWFSNDSLYTLEGPGSPADKSFEDYIDVPFSRTRRPQFIEDGRRLFAFQGNGKVYSFNLVSKYNLSTIDFTSKTTMVFGNFNDAIWTCKFSPSGLQALVSMVSSSYVYQVSCQAPYSLNGANFVRTVSFPTSINSMSIVNGGSTLIVGGGKKLYEYNLSA